MSLKKLKCRKCKKKFEKGVIVVVGGENYLFCHDCYEPLKHCSYLTISQFHGAAKKENWLKRRMREARERRARGETLW